MRSFVITAAMWMTFQLTTDAIAQNVCFLPAVQYTTGNGPYALSAADLNGDGAADLVTSNYYSNNVAILMNSGSGSFMAPVYYAAGSGPQSVFAADLDDDDDVDLAIANAESDNVTVLKNNGNGTFSAGVDYAVVDGPTDVYADDLDGDNFADLAVTNIGHSPYFNDSTVSILFNDGDGSFSAAVNYTAGEHPRSIIAIDLDKDSDVDLVTTNITYDVSVLKNNGEGIFAKAVKYAVAQYAYSVFAADLDRDGDPDLAVANWGDDLVSVLKNYGYGTFAEAVNYSVGDYPSSVFAADLDGDQDRDIVVANFNSDNISVLRNNGSGNFSLVMNRGAGNGPFAVVATDLDGDSDADLAVANAISNNVSVLANCAVLMEVRILDGQLNPLTAGTPLRLSTVANDPPLFTETYVGEFTTDEQSRIKIPAYLQGAHVKIEKRLQTLPAFKHKAILDTAYTVVVDNATFSHPDGDVSYDLLTGVAGQTISLTHTAVHFDLVVSVEWDASTEYLSGLENNLRLAANYLYDVSDGQATLEHVLIYDAKRHWNDCDLRIGASNTAMPVTTGLYGFKSRTVSNFISMPPKWFGNRDCTAYYLTNEFPLALTSSSDFMTKIHNIGHYFLGFADEWMLRSGTQEHHLPVYGFMEDPIRSYTEEDPAEIWCTSFECTGHTQCDHVSGPRSSEMSRSSVEYSDHGRNLQQWTINGLGCSDQFERDFEKAYGGIYARILRPDEWPYNQELSGPNDDFGLLSYDVGRLVDLTTDDYKGGASEPLMGAHSFVGPLEVRIVKETPYPSPGTIRMGILTPEPSGGWGNGGLIRLRGYNTGDRVIASGKGLFPAENPGQPANMSLNRTGAEYGWASGAGPLIDSAGESFIDLHPVHGILPFIHAASFTGAGVTYELTAQNHPSTVPQLEVVPDGTIFGNSYSLLQNGDLYSTDLSDSLGESGILTLYATDDSLDTFFVENRYITQPLDDSIPLIEVYGPDGASCIVLDSANGADQNVLILSSNYPPLRNGLTTGALQAGRTVCFSLSGGETLQGTNAIILYFSAGDLGVTGNPNETALSLKVFRWDRGSSTWIEMGGTVDTVNSLISVPVTSTGIYAAFTDCACDCHGDPGGNCDGTQTVLDVVAAIGVAFRNSNPVPDPNASCPHETTDVTCDHATTVVDVVKLVNVAFRNANRATEFCNPCAP